MLDDVKCSGNEDRLLECQSSSVLSHNCLHNEEAGVTCHAYGEWRAESVMYATLVRKKCAVYSTNNHY